MDKCSFELSIDKLIIHSYTVISHDTSTVQNQWELYMDSEKLIYTIYR